MMDSKRLPTIAYDSHRNTHTINNQWLLLKNAQTCAFSKQAILKTNLEKHHKNHFYTKIIFVFRFSINQQQTNHHNLINNVHRHRRIRWYRSWYHLQLRRSLAE